VAMIGVHIEATLLRATATMLLPTPRVIVGAAFLAAMTGHHL